MHVKSPEISENHHKYVHVKSPETRKCLENHHRYMSSHHENVWKKHHENMPSVQVHNFIVKIIINISSFYTHQEMLGNHQVHFNPSEPQEMFEKSSFPASRITIKTFWTTSQNLWMFKNKNNTYLNRSSGVA